MAVIIDSNIGNLHQGIWLHANTLHVGPGAVQSQTKITPSDTLQTTAAKRARGKSRDTLLHTNTVVRPITRTIASATASLESARHALFSLTRVLGVQVAS